MTKIRVTIWNEFRHERENSPVGEYIRNIYPDGIHRCLAEHLAAGNLEIRAVSLDDPEQGLPDDLLNNTDVLIWWGHCAHAEVKDELVDRIQARVLAGMGLIVLHSGHYSKIFRRMMGTTCLLHWREIGEKERVWVVNAAHPIARNIPETFVIPHHEMYGESFDIPQDGNIVFMSWFEGGNVFRSGVTFQRGRGKIFYFSPGHETFPIYHDPVILQILSNAVNWAAPLEYLPKMVTKQREPLEEVRSENPLDKLDTSALHR